MSTKFSVLIPMEFHRGLATRCVSGWTQRQDFPRSEFEVIVAAPRRGDAAETASVAAVLGPQDRLLFVDANHDMPLVAAAARQSLGENLVLTEAHCLPRPDFLSQAATVFADQPTWSGFSGLSIPLTHNLLSEIEADMYAGDIQDHLENHPWLKVLDQCFVIRRTAYEKCGGIEPEYGHFAEWLLAARLHIHGFAIGHDRRPAIEHWYCGDLEELAEFTRDFAIGQMRFARNAESDPCGRLFDPVPMWSNRWQLDPLMPRYMRRLLARDLTEIIKRGRFRSLRSWPWKNALYWLSIGSKINSLLDVSQHRERRSKQQVARCLRRTDRNAAAAAFREFIEASTACGCAEYIQQWLARPEADKSTLCELNFGWSCQSPYGSSSSGIHEVECHNDTVFRWTEPAAMIQLPHLSGEWTIEIHWMPFSVPVGRDYRFYCDEHLIEAHRVGHCGYTTTLRIMADQGQAHRLSWVVPRRKAPSDPRDLGMGIQGISWYRSEQPRSSLGKWDDDPAHSRHVEGRRVVCRSSLSAHVESSSA
ncbi:MAG: hypothetical protein O3C60_01820 [Planctomycetota bacterium]|nr:hypothetical protein [Planctomycetota bacterium]